MARIKALSEIIDGLKAKVYTFDNLSPVSRVAVYVRAGSRYEPNALPGIAHFLKASAGITTERSSIFGMPRHLERIGTSLQVSVERDHLVYRVDCMRDKLDFVLDFVEDQLHRPEFRPWELVDEVQPRVKNDLKYFKENQFLVTREALHKAAYRGGLAHSTFCPEHQVSKIKKDHLFDFVQKNFVPSRMSFVGLGVSADELNHLVESKFSFNNSEYAGVDGASRYVGGEARIQAGFDKTLVNVVVEGSAIGDLKRVAVLEILGNILGGYNQVYMKYGAGAQKSLAYLLSSSAPQAKSSIININHSDTGLFGFSIQGPNDQLSRAVKDSLKHVRTVLSSVTEEDLKLSKASTKARSLIVSEDAEASYNAMARRCVAGAADADPIAIIDSLTLKDVHSVVSSLLKSKLTMVSVGNPRFVPYLDEIEA